MANTAIMTQKKRPQKMVCVSGVVRICPPVPSVHFLPAHV